MMNLKMEEEYVVERSLSTLVQPRCMSQLLQGRNRVSDFGPGRLGSKIPAGEKVISIFSPVTHNCINFLFLLVPGQVN